MPTLPSSDVSVDQLDVAASSEEQEPAPFPVRWVIAGVVVLVLAVSGFVMHRRQQQKSRAFLLSKAIANRSREAQQEPPNNGHVERRVSDMSFVPGLSQPRSHADYRDEAPLGQQYETYEQHQIPNDPPNAIVPSQQQLESFEHNNPNDQSNNVNAMQQQQQQDQTYDHQQMHNDQGAYNHDSYQEQLYQEHGQFYSDEPVCYYAPDQAYYDQAQQPPSHTQPRDPIIDQTMD